VKAEMVQPYVDPASQTTPVEAEASAPSEEHKEEEKSEVPIEKIRWMYFHPSNGWTLYSIDASRELEEAARDGKTNYIITIGLQIHRVKIDRLRVSIDDSDSDMAIRKHVVSDGLQGKWEILTTKYEKPHGLMGAGVLKLFEKVWSSFESMKGESCGLGFIFLYSLLSGESRRKVISGD
jgi:hypothetical protein